MKAEQEKVASDKVVRCHVYDNVMREGLPPTITYRETLTSPTSSISSIQTQSVLSPKIILPRSCRDSYRTLFRIYRINASLPTATHCFIGFMLGMRLVRALLWDS